MRTIPAYSVYATVLCSFMLGTTVQAQTTKPLSPAMQDLQTLSSEAMQGREIGSPGSALAREYILKRIHELGLQPCTKDNNYIQEFAHTDKRGNTKHGKNIIACQTGSLALQKSKIVVSAHYDHLGSRNGSTYLGADDNASGVAGALAVAASFKTNTPQNTIIYAFFDGEEQGLLGAHSFIQQAPTELSSIALNLNFDMIARGDKNELYLSGTHQTPALKPLLENLNGTQGIKLIFGHDRPEQGNDDWTPQSDHYAFFKAGIAHLYMGVEDHADYHKVTDSFDKVNPIFFDGSVEIARQAVRKIDQALLKPEFLTQLKKSP